MSDREIEEQVGHWDGRDRGRRAEVEDHEQTAPAEAIDPHAHE